MISRHDYFSVAIKHDRETTLDDIGLMLCSMLFIYIGALRLRLV